MSTELPTHLAQLGEALERACACDLAAPRRSRARRWLSRHMVVSAAAVLVGVPAAALAATQLLTSPAQVAAGLPAANRWLEGTDPTCTVVTPNVEYHCVLAQPPRVGPVSSPAESTRRLTLPVSVAIGRLHRTGSITRVHGVTEIHLEDGLTCVVGAMPKLACARHRGILTPRPAQAWSTGATTATGASGTTSAATDWTGTVEPTVDVSKHVNGGCRALNAAGTEWECYLGETAVTQQIISQGFLGQYEPVPGVG
jgi:hypothetical protein